MNLGMNVQKCSGQKRPEPDGGSGLSRILEPLASLENGQNAPLKTLENDPKTQTLADGMKRWAHRAHILSTALYDERLLVIEEGRA